MNDPAHILIIFDLDFTLIDNSYVIINAFNYALRQFHHPPPNPSKIRQKIGTPLQEMFLEYLPEPAIDSAVKFFRDYYESHFYEKVRILPGVLPLLKKLQRCGYKLAILTAKRTDLAICLLNHIGLAKYFDLILGEEKTIPPKPDPASIHFIISQFPGIQKVFMVGDHIVDCLAAKRAGISFIGVQTGTTTEEMLQQCVDHTGFILKNLQEFDPSMHLI
ncbi:MAG: HAD family hydrolase [Candidatus Helarchaeota archaeon]